jgi:hypothetical protein
VKRLNDIQFNYPVRFVVVIRRTLLIRDKRPLTTSRDDGIQQKNNLRVKLTLVTQTVRCVSIYRATSTANCRANAQQFTILYQLGSHKNLMISNLNIDHLFTIIHIHPSL